jgi:hypothetical protein
MSDWMLLLLSPALALTAGVVAYLMARTPRSRRTPAE